MSQPEWIELSRADFVTVGATGLPGQRTFYLQAAQGELVVTLVIEKEQAAAIAIAVGGALQQLGEGGETLDLPAPDLIHPVEPLFRVGKLELGYDQSRDMLVIVAEELVAEGEQGDKVRIWATHEQMAALARQAAIAVASGRPICPLCNEVIDPGEEHVCARDNGRKRLYELEGD
jgi:uncharacterized repeat protein (TIGR03847 family)